MESYEIKNQINQYMQIRPALASKVKELAATNEPFKKMLEIFSLRERSRREITLSNLITVMAYHGARYEHKDYEQALYNLASLGVGTIYRDVKGNLKSLKNIKYSLQALGSLVKTEPVPEPVFIGEEQGDLTTVEVRVFGKTFEIKMKVEDAAKYLVSFIQRKA